MPLYTDSQCVIRTEFLVGCWACDGSGEDDGEYYLHALFHVAGKKERTGWSYPTQRARDAAIQAIGTLASTPMFSDEEAN